MIRLPFPTRKLQGSLVLVRERVSDLDIPQDEVTVYGVTNEVGITVTGRRTSDDISDYIVVRGAQIAFNPYRVNVGSLGVSPPNFLGAVSPAYVVVGAKKDIDPVFLAYYLKSPIGLNLIRWYGDRGGVRSALRFKDLGQIDFPDLTLAEQKSVLDRVASAGTKVSGLTAEIEAQAALVQTLRRCILDEAMRGRLTERDPNDEPAAALLKRISAEKHRRFKAGEIRKPKMLPPVGADEAPFDVPEGWTWARLGSIGEWGAGATPSRGETSYYAGGTIPWLKTGELNDGVIDAAEERVTDLALAECSLRLNPPGSVLIAMYGATIGKLGLLDIEATTNQACCACQLLGGVPSMYLFYYLMSKRQDFRDLGAGGAQPNISKAKLTFELIPLPPVEEQRRIVERADHLMALCDQLDARLGAATEDARRLAQAILAEALSS